MKKAKRRLTVDPVDFLLGWDPSTTSRTPQDQASVSHDITDSDGGLREPMLCDADVAAIFQHGDLDPEMSPQNDDTGSAEYRTGPSRSVSRLSYSSCGSGSLAGLRGCSSYLPSLEHSEAEDEPLHQNRFYQRHPGSQESLNAASAAPQISDLDRRMSAVENLLNRLEQKVTSSNSKVTLGGAKMEAASSLLGGSMDAGRISGT
ncbi:PREDICTED: uncharacterized protein LOC107081175 [Cyprinodon variegatus]|uniref:uncharacterized protein LOC107081175 n=1 Tax=Cyprinodon variegatus TaxID=28743 RepID=UPI0007428C17|nr:PREDICTED: uncharacterized protein LOC107081175 [Cyprinodon variegatus]